jgi:hypothetical protein
MAGEDTGGEGVAGGDLADAGFGAHVHEVFLLQGGVVAQRRTFTGSFSA